MCVHVCVCACLFPKSVWCVVPAESTFSPQHVHAFFDSLVCSNRERAIDYLNTQNTLYVFDGFAGWDPDYRIKIRVITSRAYHCLFMNNMLIRPTKEELLHFGEPGLESCSILVVL